MPVLLSDKEMQKLNRLPDEYGKIYATARAQLKNVVEWLGTFEFYDDFGGDSGRTFRDMLVAVLAEEL